MSDQIHRKRIIVNGEVFYPITDADSVIHLQKEITDKLPIVSDIQPASGTFVPKQAWLDISEEEPLENLIPNEGGGYQIEHEESISGQYEPNLNGSSQIEHNDLSPNEGSHVEHEDVPLNEGSQIEHDDYEESVQVDHNDYGGSSGIGAEVEHSDIAGNITIIEHEDPTLPDYHTEN